MFSPCENNGLYILGVAASNLCFGFLYCFRSVMKFVYLFLYSSRSSASNEQQVEEDFVFERIKEDSFSEQEVSVHTITDATEEERLVTRKEKSFNKDELRITSSEDLLQLLTKPEAMNREVFILELLIKREGMKCVTPEGKVFSDLKMDQFNL